MAQPRRRFGAGRVVGHALGVHEPSAATDRRSQLPEPSRPTLGLPGAPSAPEMTQRQLTPITGYRVDDDHQLRSWQAPSCPSRSRRVDAACLASSRTCLGLRAAPASRRWHTGSGSAHCRRAGTSSTAEIPFGCQVIVELVARHPERVACAVLQGPTMDAAARSLPARAGGGCAISSGSGPTRRRGYATTATPACAGSSPPTASPCATGSRSSCLE
jgi:hypothetical protein